MAANYSSVVYKNAYVKLATQTLTNSSSYEVNFTNIPQNFTDLVVVANIGMVTAGNNMMLRFNADTGNNYDSLIFEGRTGSSYAVKYTNNAGIYCDYNGGAVSAINRIYKIHVMQYANPSIKKPVLIRGNIADSGGLVNLISGCYDTTSPITSVRLTTNGAQLLTGSTFTLYGVQASKTPKAFGGDQVYTDGTYWYHIFKNSGVFTPQTSITADYLVVAGGGGGSGGFPGSGGGAGGFRTSVGASTLSLTNGGYPVIVGAGGGGGYGGVNPSPGYLATDGRKGSDSSFGGITSTGGGQGTTPVNQGAAGGSGGGGGHYGGAAGTGNFPSTSPSQGNNGGAGTTSSPSQGGGGGGGAGAVGGSATGASAGSGGAGASSSLSGATVTYAGGGGAGYFNGGNPGTGGAGGGGNGGTVSDITATHGSNNTGGGGGGGGRDASLNYGQGGNGGSGIVIVRYSV